jgi:hypothetical protein
MEYIKSFTYYIDNQLFRFEIQFNFESNQLAYGQNELVFGKFNGNTLTVFYF